MMTELQSELLNDGCYVKTIINASTYTFNWTLENFSKFELDTEKNSPTFHPLPNCAFYAALKIKNNFTPYLFFHCISETSIEVKYKVSIENSAGQVLVQHFALHKCNSSNPSCDVLPTCDIEIKKAREEDVLILKCDMEFFGEDKINTYYYKPCSIPVVSPLDDLSALSNELKAIYDKPLYADVNLKVGEGIVRGHKLILCARSSVFARMFETPMEEREENVINITDLDLLILKDLVSYMYTGVLAKDDFESAYALYYAADKYDVPSLRKKCVAILLSKLDVENACRVLVLADQHSDVEFKNLIIDFVKFYFDKVLETDFWVELVKNSPRLATEVISAWSKNRTNKVDNNKT